MKNLFLILFVFSVKLAAQDYEYIPPVSSIVDRQFNFHVVDKNVWRSAQPSPEAITSLKRNYHLKTILNLRGVTEAEDSEALLADSLGIKYIHFSMDGRRHQDADTLQMLLHIVNDSLNYPILIHCLGGKDRTGLVVSLYKLEKYKTPIADLITEMLMYGQDSIKFPEMINALKLYQVKQK